MKTIKSIVQQASEYLPEDIEFGLVRELEKRDQERVTNALKEAAEKIENLESETEITDWSKGFNYACHKMRYTIFSLIKDTKQAEEKCECGGNKRISQDCTMKPCKYPQRH